MLAVDGINAAGGVGGRRIRVITEDDQSKAEEAANAVTKLISSNDVIAIIGEVASSNSLAAAPIAVQARHLGINGPVVGCDGRESPKLLEIGGKAPDGWL